MASISRADIVRPQKHAAARRVGCWEVTSDLVLRLAAIPRASSLSIRRKVSIRIYKSAPIYFYVKRPRRFASISCYLNSDVSQHFETMASRLMNFDMIILSGEVDAAVPISTMHAISRYSALYSKYDGRNNIAHFTHQDISAALLPFIAQLLMSCRPEFHHWGECNSGIAIICIWEQRLI